MGKYQFSGRVVLVFLASLWILAACSEAEKEPFQGYVEGDYLYLAAPSAGYLETLAVDRGTYVSAGTPAFSIDAEPDRFELAEAVAQANSAREKIRNLEEPRRQPEIAELEARLKAKEANLRYSESQLERSESLVGKGFVSQADVDLAKSARDADAAEVEAVRKQLALYRINLGRKPEILGAEAELESARAKSDQKTWFVDKKSVSAPANGQITETYYRPGEWVPAGQPVLSFLPDDRRRIRFFVPEMELGGIRLGQEVEADCDGCRSPIRAKVNFIAPQAEYTPPVIYSRETRAKLVFRIEALPEAREARRLHPGLPVEVRLLDGE